MKRLLPLVAKRNTHRPLPHGFSLVEVTLALGIVAFALIPLLAMVPMGLTAATASIRQTAQAHIIQQIAGDISMLSFDDLDNYLTPTYHYDYDGRLVDNVNEASFSVTLTRKNAQFPGSTNAPGMDTHLQQVVVEIGQPGNTTAAKTRSTLSISNSGL